MEVCWRKNGLNYLTGNLLQNLNQHLNTNFKHRGFMCSLTVPKVYSCTFRGNNDNESDTIKTFIRLKNGEGSENIHYSTFYEGIPNEFKDVALKELNETEENKRIGLLKLRDFLKRKGISDVEDCTLLIVLRNCKYDIKKSEKKLMKFLQTHDMLTKWLQTADFERLKLVFKHRFVGILPYRDKYGRVIFYTTPYDIDFELYGVDDGKICAFCLLFYALSFPLTSITGVAYIAECKTPSISDLYHIAQGYRQYLPTLLTLPFRAAKADFINENFVVRWAFNIVRPFIASKLLQRVKFHGNAIEGLQDAYHPAILPEEFGGTMGPLSPKPFMEDLFNFIRKLKYRKLYL